MARVRLEMRVERETWRAGRRPSTSVLEVAFDDSAEGRAPCSPDGESAALAERGSAAPSPNPPTETTQ